MLKKLTIAVILLAVGLVAGLMVSVAAQVQPRSPVVIEPNVIAGADVGFIPTGFNGKTPTGRLVVRINGKWVDVQLSGGQSVLLK